MLLPAALSGLGVNAYNVSQIARTTPAQHPTSDAINHLGSAFEQRVDKIAPGRKPQINLSQNEATEHPLKTLLKGDTSKFSNNSRDIDRNDLYAVDINPNADRSYFAHELGHVASDQTDIGRLIRSARGNKALTRSLAAAAILGGTGLSAMEAGDEDLDTAVALAYAASIPTIADEILATKNGLAIMDTANMRATLGQRGRMASGLLSYLGAPLLMGATTNLVGNQFDEDVQNIA